MNIGQLSKASGLNAKSIRYYESIGLIPPAERSGGNYRVYRASDVPQLQFVRRARNLGFSLQEIKILLSLWQNQQCSSVEFISADVKALALRHIHDLEARMAEMQAMLDVLRPLAPGSFDAQVEHPIPNIEANSVQSGAGKEMKNFETRDVNN